MNILRHLFSILLLFSISVGGAITYTTTAVWSGEVRVAWVESNPSAQDSPSICLVASCHQADITDALDQSVIHLNRSHQLQAAVLFKVQNEIQQRITPHWIQWALTNPPLSSEEFLENLHFV